MGWAGDLCRTFSNSVCSLVASNTAVARDPLYGNLGLNRVNAILHGVKGGVITYKSHAEGLAVGKEYSNTSIQSLPSKFWELLLMIQTSSQILSPTK